MGGGKERCQLDVEERELCPTEELTFSQPGWLQAWTRLPFFARLIRCVGVVPSLNMLGMAGPEVVEELVLEDDSDASEGCLLGVRRFELALAPKVVVAEE